MFRTVANCLQSNENRESCKMDDFDVLRKRMDNFEESLKWLSDIKWMFLALQLLLHIALLYGFYLACTENIDIWTYVWRKRM